MWKNCGTMENHEERNDINSTQIIQLDTLTSAVKFDGLCPAGARDKSDVGDLQ